MRISGKQKHKYNATFGKSSGEKRVQAVLYDVTSHETHLNSCARVRLVNITISSFFYPKHYTLFKIYFNFVI